MGQEEWFSKEQIGDALIKARGIQSDAAEILGCTRQTVFNYVKRYPELKEIIDASYEVLADCAEGSVWRLIQADDGPTVRWALGKFRPGRYGERTDIHLRAELTGANGEPIQLQVEVANHDADRVDSILRIMAEAGVLAPKLNGSGTREGSHP